MTKTPHEMREMQKELDDDRSAFSSFIREMTLLNSENATLKPFLDSARELVILNEDRERSASAKPSNLSSFQERQYRESEFQQEAIYHLSIAVQDAGDLEYAHHLRRELERLQSIPDKERKLFEARRNWGRKISADAKNILHFGADNQILDIARSGGQSIESLKYVRNPKFKREPPTLELKIARDAAIAEIYAAGNCAEQAFWVITELNKRLPGTPIAVATWVKGNNINHAYSIIGRPNFPESAYVDTWPSRATVTNWSNYGLQYTKEYSTLFQTVADGRDLRKEAEAWIRRPLPSQLETKPPIDLEATLNYVRREGITAANLVTGTTDGHNSDSDSDDRLDDEFTLSRAAMMRSVAYEYQHDQALRTSVQKVFREHVSAFPNFTRRS